MTSLFSDQIPETSDQKKPPLAWLLPFWSLVSGHWSLDWQSGSVAALAPSGHLPSAFLAPAFLATCAPLPAGPPFLRSASSSEMTRARSSAGISAAAGSFGGMLMFG